MPFSAAESLLATRRPGLRTEIVTGWADSLNQVSAMADAAIGFHPRAVSVVIATLGGPTLGKTIETLNRGSIVPAEILICIPAGEASRVTGLSFSNVRVLTTSCRGQVAQRIEGFRRARHDFVVQLDDDTLVDEKCLQYLLDILAKFHDVAVAPALVNFDTGESVYKLRKEAGYVRKIYHWLMNGTDGYLEGRIEKSGSPIGIVPDEGVREHYEVEWLAGGCVMHRKKNLILENYFPFVGKAYCEDLIHSHLLTQKGVRLMVVSRARCGFEVQSAFDREFPGFLRETLEELVARKYFMRLSGRGLARMYLFYVLVVVAYMVKTLAKHVNGVQAAHSGAHSSSRVKPD